MTGCGLKRLGFLSEAIAVVDCDCDAGTVVLDHRRFEACRDGVLGRLNWTVLGRKPVPSCVSGVTDIDISVLYSNLQRTDKNSHGGLGISRLLAVEVGEQRRGPIEALY